MTIDGQSRHFPIGEVSRPGNLPNIPVLHTQDSPARRTTRTLIDQSHRLRPRDYTIASLLHEHTTLTTDHLAEVLFTNAVTCRHRLNTLRKIGFVDRFLRNRPGAPNPVCWVPGALSARLMALAAGETPPSVRALRERQDRVYANPALEHLLHTNGFFICLLAYARTHRQARLRRWWSERGTAGAFGQRIHPDGHGVWADDGQETGFHLEYDRGTEPIGKLTAKLASHRRLCAEGGPTYPVLFVLPSRAREQNLHRRLAERPEPSLVVATTSPESGLSPAEAVWRLVGNGRHRLRLADLPSSHGQPGPLNPGPPTPDQDPLHLLG